MRHIRLFFEQLETRRVLAAYTIKVVDDLDLISTDTEQLIVSSSTYALTNLSQHIAWKGILDTEVRIRPASENPNPNADGLMPSIISTSWTGDGWSNDTLQEILTGVDSKPQSADAGMTIYLGQDGQIRNYGFLAWFDPNPIAYLPANVPDRSFDFIGVFCRCFTELAFSLRRRNLVISPQRLVETISSLGTPPSKCLEDRCHLRLG